MRACAQTVGIIDTDDAVAAPCSLNLAYSIYALFEWSLIFFDVAFDAVALVDLKRLEIRVVDLGARAEQEVIGTPRCVQRIDGFSDSRYSWLSIPYYRAAPRAYLAPPLAGSEMHPPFLVETWLKTLVSYTTEMREFSSSAYMGTSPRPYPRWTPMLTRRLVDSSRLLDQPHRLAAHDLLLQRVEYGVN